MWLPSHKFIIALSLSIVAVYSLDSRGLILGKMVYLPMVPAPTRPTQSKFPQVAKRPGVELIIFIPTPGAEVEGAKTEQRRKITFPLYAARVLGKYLYVRISTQTYIISHTY